MSSGLDWERFGVITGGDEACILPPPTLSEKGVGIPNFVHFPHNYNVAYPTCKGRSRPESTFPNFGKETFENLENDMP